MFLFMGLKSSPSATWTPALPRTSALQNPLPWVRVRSHLSHACSVHVSLVHLSNTSIMAGVIGAQR